MDYRSYCDATTQIESLIKYYSKRFYNLGAENILDAEQNCRISCFKSYNRINSIGGFRFIIKNCFLDMYRHVVYISKQSNELSSTLEAPEYFSDIEKSALIESLPEKDQIILSLLIDEPNFQYVINKLGINRYLLDKYVKNRRQIWMDVLT